MHSNRMICIKLKVSWELYKELQLCPEMILTRSHTSGSLKFIPDSTSSQTLDTSNANQSVNLKRSTLAPNSNRSVLRSSYSNSSLKPSLSNTINVVPTSVTTPFYIPYSTLSKGNSITPIKNVSPSTIYPSTIPKNTKTVSNYCGDLPVQQMSTDIGVLRNNSSLDRLLTDATISGDCKNSNVSPTVAGDAKISSNSNARNHAVPKSILRKCIVSQIANVVRNQEMNINSNKALSCNKTTDTGLPPTAKQVSSYGKEPCHYQDVISNEEITKSDTELFPNDKTGSGDSESSVIKVSNDGQLNIRSSKGLMNSMGNNFLNTTISTKISAENFKASLDLDGNPSSSVSSIPAADSILKNLIVVRVIPEKVKIKYPRECDKCLKVFKWKSSFSAHKKRCGMPRKQNKVGEIKKVSKPLTFEEACSYWKKKYPNIYFPKPCSPSKDKKWLQPSGKEGLYVKSATLNEKQEYLEAQENFVSNIQKQE